MNKMINAWCILQRVHKNNNNLFFKLLTTHIIAQLSIRLFIIIICTLSQFNFGTEVVAKEAVRFRYAAYIFLL
jgi:hypothetical protein